MAQTEQIKEALLKLDPENKTHWTNDGMPIVAALGLDGVKRADITAVAPHFTRDNPVIEIVQPEGEPEVAETEAEEPEVIEDEPEVATVEAEAKTTLDKQIEIAEKEFHEARKKLDALIIEKDKVIAAQEQKMVGKTTQDDIQAFLASQRKLREQRAAKIKQMDDLMKRQLAPIDQAFAQKNKRPTYPTKE